MVDGMTAAGSGLLGCPEWCQHDAETYDDPFTHQRVLVEEGGARVTLASCGP
jgi:hypothetical protein